MYLIRTESGLNAGCDASNKLIASLGTGEQIEVELIDGNPHSVQEMKLLWAVAKSVAASWPEGQQFQPVSDKHLVHVTEEELGLGEYVQNMKGQTVFMRKSISFAKMPNKVRHKFIQDALAMWSKILGASVEELTNQEGL
jgi:hypothetical protein